MKTGNVNYDPSNILEVRGITKKFKGFTLDHVSFNLPKGYILGYVGPNGAGKTTTINAIAGITKADSGEVILDGMSYKEAPARYKEEIGFIGDSSFFPPLMKIDDICKIMKNFFPTFDADKFDGFVKRWELPKKKKIMDFSRGMQVKLMFATVFSRETKLMILDEATNGLDPVFREDVLRMLQNYIQDGERSILFSTHIMDDLEQIADYIVLINHGKIILQNSKESLEENYILVKGDNKDLPRLNQYLIGIQRQDFGFSALVHADYALHMPSDYVMEKPSVNQIVTRLLREQDGRGNN